MIANSREVRGEKFLGPTTSLPLAPKSQSIPPPMAPPPHPHPFSPLPPTPQI